MGVSSIFLLNFSRNLFLAVHNQDGDYLQTNSNSSFWSLLTLKNNNSSLYTHLYVRV